MSKKSIASALFWIIMSYAVAEGIMWLLGKYVEMIRITGTERSPFDRWVIKAFATQDEKEAINYAIGSNNGGTVSQITDSYKKLPIETISSASPVNVWRVCSVEDSRVCLMMPPDGSIIFLAEIDKSDQKCRTTLSYNGKSMSLAETYINNKTLSVYTLRTKTGRGMADVVRYATEFNISYACEFGPYGSYGFKLKTPLGGTR